MNESTRQTQDETPGECLFFVCAPVWRRRKQPRGKKAKGNSSAFQQLGSIQLSSAVIHPHTHTQPQAHQPHSLRERTAC